jgi:hypothetical protein
MRGIGRRDLEEQRARDPAPVVPEAPSASATPPARVLSLQRSAGNASVARMLARQPAAAVEEVGTFFPMEGLTVSVTGQKVVISGTLLVEGAEATPANLSAGQATINSYWTKSFPDGFAVTCNVALVPKGSGSGATIVMAKADKDSHVNMATETMHLNMNESNALTWTIAHEFGHMLGMKDRYSETVWSRIKFLVGAQRDGTKADPGYEGNVMADVSGQTESKNVKDLTEENKPGYFRDDDDVRAWAAAHPPAEIGALSAESLNRMIDRLMAGWISAADVDAMIRILDSVTDPAKSQAVKSHVESQLLDMTSIGQRTQIRVALSRMP